MCNNLKFPSLPVWQPQVNITQNIEHHTTAATTGAQDTGIFSFTSFFTRLTTTLIYLQILIDMLWNRNHQWHITRDNEQSVWSSPTQLLFWSYYMIIANASDDDATPQQGNSFFLLSFSITTLAIIAPYNSNNSHDGSHPIQKKGFHLLYAYDKNQ
jgi:hypothetical protein